MVAAHQGVRDFRHRAHGSGLGYVSLSCGAPLLAWPSKASRRSASSPQERASPRPPLRAAGRFAVNRPNVETDSPDGRPLRCPGGGRGAPSSGSRERLLGSLQLFRFLGHARSIGRKLCRLKLREGPGRRTRSQSNLTEGPGRSLNSRDRHGGHHTCWGTLIDRGSYRWGVSREVPCG
jgi:hypothetical protein